MIYQYALKESSKLEQKIASLKQKLEKFPEGSIICAKNGNNYKWYRTDGKKPIYLPKTERKLAEQLALKKYLSLQLEEHLQEKKALDSYLRNHKEPSGKAEQLLSSNSEYRRLLSPYFKPISQELNDWMNVSYERNNYHPEHLIHKTSSGNLVRSKSEALIDTFLYLNKIPFRYECALHLGEAILYPDFTIRHPVTGETYYWEHFGLMDDPAYCQNAFSKLQLYSEYGLVPTIHLITTYETREHPLSSETVEKVVKEYFL